MTAGDAIIAMASNDVASNPPPNFDGILDPSMHSAWYRCALYAHASAALAERNTREGARKAVIYITFLPWGDKKQCYLQGIVVVASTKRCCDPCSHHDTVVLLVPRQPCVLLFACERRAAETSYENARQKGRFLLAKKGEGLTLPERTALVKELLPQMPSDGESACELSSGVADVRRASGMFVCTHRGPISSFVGAGMLRKMGTSGLQP